MIGIDVPIPVPMAYHSFGAALGVLDAARVSAASSQVVRLPGGAG